MEFSANSFFFRLYAIDSLNEPQFDATWPSATVEIDRLDHSFVIDSPDFSTSTFIAIVLHFLSLSLALSARSLLLRFIVAVIETRFKGDTRSWSDFPTRNRPLLLPVILYYVDERGPGSARDRSYVL